MVRCKSGSFAVYYMHSILLDRISVHAVNTIHWPKMVNQTGKHHPASFSAGLRKPFRNMTRPNEAGSLAYLCVLRPESLCTGHHTGCPLVRTTALLLQRALHWHSRVLSTKCAHLTPLPLLACCLVTLLGHAGWRWWWHESGHQYLEGAA